MSGLIGKFRFQVKKKKQLDARMPGGLGLLTDCAVQDEFADQRLLATVATIRSENFTFIYKSRERDCHWLARNSATKITKICEKKKDQSILNGDKF